MLRDSGQHGDFSYRLNFYKLLQYLLNRFCEIHIYSQTIKGEKFCTWASFSDGHPSSSCDTPRPAVPPPGHLFKGMSHSTLSPLPRLPLSPFCGGLFLTVDYLPLDWALSLSNHTLRLTFHEGGFPLPCPLWLLLDFSLCLSAFYWRHPQPWPSALHTAAPQSLLNRWMLDCSPIPS